MAANHDSITGQEIMDPSSPSSPSSPSLTEPLLLHNNNNDDGSSNHSSSDSLISFDSSEEEQEETSLIIQQNDNNNNEEETTPTPKRSRNINLILAYTLIAFAGRSTWNQSVLSSFIFLLRDDNPEYVGFVTAIMGISQLVTSFPSGYLSDKYRRDSVLKIASLVGFIAAFCTIISSTRYSFVLLSSSLAMWGLFWGLSNPPIVALFADSMEDGDDRSYYFTQRSVLQMIGNSMGPVVALTMFWYLGDEWSVGECAAVICFGQVLALPAVLLLCFLNDDDCIVSEEEEEEEEGGQGGAGVGENEEEYNQENEESNNNDDNNREDATNIVENVDEDSDGLSYDDTTTTVDNDLNNNVSNDDDDVNNDDDVEEGLGLGQHTEIITTNDLSQPLLPMTNNKDSQSQSETSSSTNITSDTNTTTTPETYFYIIPKSKIIPVLIATSDMTGGLAAGMSIRFFPIFFLDNLLLSPQQVQITYILSTIAMAVLSKYAHNAGQRIGRLQFTVITKWIGVGFMLTMVACYQYNTSSIVIRVLFILRMAFMNSSSALTKSVLMDTVPSNERAKWSSLESVNMFGWAGSAVLGGVLVQEESIIFNFVITAISQFFATLPLVVVIRRFHQDLLGGSSDSGGGGDS